MKMEWPTKSCRQQIGHQQGQKHRPQKQFLLFFGKSAPTHKSINAAADADQRKVMNGIWDRNGIVKWKWMEKEEEWLDGLTVNGVTAKNGGGTIK